MASLLLAAPALEAATVRLQVEGLTGDLQKNVRARLSTIGNDEVSNDGRFRARVSVAIKEGLRALGYYEPEIDFESRPAPPKGGRPVLVARVTPGEPVKIGGSSIVIEGDARNDADYKAWVAQGRPKVGTQLNHGQYDKFKSGFSNLALRNGYFDGNFKKSQLGVSVERREAFWDIDYDSGQRYRFGDVSFEGSPIREEYLQNLVPFKQ
ncbi:MAG: POTRA domain-containing protein, partial [Pantoea sp.]|nr:POTRA domain-containing protein [Pantoea sp.]